MRAELHLRLSTLYGFLTVLARVSGVIALAPIPGFRAGPEASRIVLAIALCLILTPAWPGQVSEGLSISSMLGTVVSELAVGLLIGATLSILLEGVQLSAQIMGLPAGFSYAS